MPDPALVPLLVSGLVTALLSFAGLELAVGWMALGASTDPGRSDD